MCECVCRPKVDMCAPVEITSLFCRLPPLLATLSAEVGSLLNLELLVSLYHTCLTFLRMLKSLILELKGQVLIH